MASFQTTLDQYEKLSVDEVKQKLDVSTSGLNDEQIRTRHKEFGLNTIHKHTINTFAILLRQFTSNPLIIILAVATFISFLLGQTTSSYYIFGLIIVSILLGFWNEYSANKIVNELLKRISRNAIVLRGVKQEISAIELTLGDVVYLTPGTIVPADLRLVQSKNLEVDQSALTGESKTVFKDATTNTNAAICLMGTSVQSGEGTGIVVGIGKMTQFGQIANRAAFVKPTTDFQKGLEKFGNLIIKVILILCVVMFIIDTLLGHNFLESALFALAIAIGLTPELLPVIVTISLAHGAGKLAKKRVVAKQLLAIENLGNMDVLCTDKTGTLTEGKITVTDYRNTSSEKDEEILKLSLLCNSAIYHHKYIGDSIDVALWNYALVNHISPQKVTKLDEEPFDFAKKAMYSVIKEGDNTLLIAKGAPDSIFSFCKDKESMALKKRFEELSNDGIRVIAVATKKVVDKQTYDWEDVRGLSIRGYITFLDQPKTTAKDALQKLASLNVETKVITGDNELVAKRVCQEVGIPVTDMLLGNQIDKLSDIKLKEKVNIVSLFARTNPEHKLRIIKALRQNGHVVGYMGDGINDIPALRAADVGISVNQAVDVAKDAASIVLLRKSLQVIADGIVEGRKTFNNTIKYILMSTSSNFGNMFSAAGASFFLPFLPMTPVQILLTNGLYDVSQTSIPTDNVDEESLVKPRHWNISFIKSYMLFFGPLSSLFDYATFGIMLFVFHAQKALFQTGWFIESVITEILVVFVIRTARTPFFVSKPGEWLILTCLIMTIIGIALPFSPFAKALGFSALPPLYFGILIGLTISYLLLVELIKNLFLKKYHL